MDTILFFSEVNPFTRHCLSILENKFDNVPKYVRTRNCSSRMLQTPNHRQIRRLGDLNAVEDAPHHDSAQDPENKLKLHFACPSKHGSA